MKKDAKKIKKIVFKHIKEDDKDFRKQIADDVKLKNKLKGKKK